MSYASFESSLRYIGRKLGANVNAHMFRHTLAQAMVDLGNLKVAQDILGHRHLETTADIYALTSQRAMVEALSAAKSHFDMGSSKPHHSLPTATNRSAANRYVFAYDEATVQELDQVTFHPSDTTT